MDIVVGREELKKFSEYPQVQSVSRSDLFLISTSDGTKTIITKDLAHDLYDITEQDCVPETVLDLTDDDYFLIHKDGKYYKIKTTDMFYEMFYFVTTGSNHLNVIRHKNLGSIFTEEQANAINSGTFKDIFLGDYWTVLYNETYGNIKLIVVDIDRAVPKYSKLYGYAEKMGIRKIAYHNLYLICFIEKPNNDSGIEYRFISNNGWWTNGLGINWTGWDAPDDIVAFRSKVTNLFNSYPSITKSCKAYVSDYFANWNYKASSDIIPTLSRSADYGAIPGSGFFTKIFPQVKDIDFDVYKAATAKERSPARLFSLAGGFSSFLWNRAHANKQLLLVSDFPKQYTLGAIGSMSDMSFLGEGSYEEERIYYTQYGSTGVVTEDNKFELIISPPTYSIMTPMVFCIRGVTQIT